MKPMNPLTHHDLKHPIQYVKHDHTDIGHPEHGSIAREYARIKAAKETRLEVVYARSRLSAIR